MKMMLKEDLNCHILKIKFQKEHKELVFSQIFHYYSDMFWSLNHFQRE